MKLKNPKHVNLVYAYQYIHICLYSYFTSSFNLPTNYQANLVKILFSLRLNFGLTSYSVSEKIRIRFYFLSFWLSVRKSWNIEEKKQKRKIKDQVKSEFVRSVPEMDLSENEVFDKLTEKAANHEETILVAKEFDSVIRSQKSGF